MPPIKNKDQENNPEKNIPENKEELTKSLHNKNLLPSLRTYQGDVASFIQSKDQSVADLAIKQRRGQEKRAREGREVETFDAPKKSNSTNFLISSLAAFLLIASAGVIVYFIYARLISAPVKISNPDSLVQENSSLSRQSVSTSDFVSQNKLTIPPALLRSLSSTITVGKYKEDFFAILQTDDYGIAFRDMLAWEPNMFTELRPLLNLTSTSTDYSQYTFKDLIVKNKDTRSFSSPYGAPALIYTFINQNTILITQSEDSLTALINAFIAGNTVR